MLWGDFISCMFGEVYLNFEGFFPLFVYFNFARGKQRDLKTNSHGGTDQEFRPQLSAKKTAWFITSLVSNSKQP